MEVADEIVVMNKGRVEQVAAPRELYDRPANEFVMSFVGRAHRLGGSWVRPHDLRILLDREDDALEAQVRRLVPLGPTVRCELEDGDGAAFAVELTRNEEAHLELEPGAIVWVRPLRETAFV